MNKNIAIITSVAVIVIFAFLAFVYVATNKPETPQGQVYDQVKTLSASDHIKWSQAKKNVLVEYSDLQCPACKSFHDYIHQQIEGDKQNGPVIMKGITFVYRNFPLTNIHKNSLNAAYAAEAASRQGKFFQMQDLMFNNQEKWAEADNANDIFVGYAKQLGLDTNTFKNDINSSAVKDKVQADLSSGNASDITATPTFFLNGQKLDNITSLDQFKQMLIDTAKQTK